MHTCRAVVVHCIDFRLGRRIKEFMEEQGLLGDADIVSFAGAAKNFVDEAAREFVMRQIELSRELHGIKEVYLINHTDCGAYGGSKNFVGLQNEQGVLVGDLRTAAKIIHDRWPGLIVKLWIARMEPSGSARLEAVE